MQPKDQFVPFSKWRPFPIVTFVDYEFKLNVNNIEFDERLIPQQLGVKEGDKFTVKIEEYGKVVLVKE